MRAALVVFVVALHARAAGAASIECARCTLPLAGAKFSITGTIDTETSIVDVTGYAPAWSVGGLTLADAVLVARTRGAGIDACVAGSWHGARLRACTRLPRAIDDIRRLRAADFKLRITGADVAGTGVAHVTLDRDYTAREIRGHVDLDVRPGDWNGMSITGGRVALAVNGSLAPLALEVAGSAHATGIDRGGVHVRDVELPFAFTVDRAAGGVELVPREPLVARAGAATLTAAGHSLEVAQPIVTLRAQPLAVATLADQPFELAIQLRAVALGPTLDLLLPGVMTARGAFDADLTVHHDRAGWRVETAHFTANPGELHARDTRWVEAWLPSANRLAIHRRVAVALADLAYDRLELVVQPPAADPESTLRVHGRGMRLDQELDVVVNLHAVRHTAARLLLFALH